MKKFKLKLGRTWANLIKGALGIIKSAISGAIKDPVGKELWLLSLQPTDKIVDALSDKDPNDKEQIRQIIQNYANSEVIPFGEGKFTQLVERIQDAQIRALVSTAGTIPFAVGKIYTDQNPGNEEQLKAFLEQWVEDGNNQAEVARAIGFYIEVLFKNNPAISSFINQTIQARIEDGDLINVDWDGDGV